MILSCAITKLKGIVEAIFADLLATLRRSIWKARFHALILREKPD